MRGSPSKGVLKPAGRPGSSHPGLRACRGCHVVPHQGIPLQPDPLELASLVLPPRVKQQAPFGEHSSSILFPVFTTFKFHPFILFSFVTLQRGETEGQRLVRSHRVTKMRRFLFLAHSLGQHYFWPPGWGCSGEGLGWVGWGGGVARSNRWVSFPARAPLTGARI